jgi:hypothetical protein
MRFCCFFNFFFTQIVRLTRIFFVFTLKKQVLKKIGIKVEFSLFKKTFNIYNKTL